MSKTIIVFLIGENDYLQAEGFYTGESQGRQASITAKAAASEEKTQRLEELKPAEQTATKRLEVVQALPPSQRTGLLTTMKELQEIQAEIKALQS